MRIATTTITAGIMTLMLAASGCGPRPPEVHPAGGTILFTGRPAGRFLVEFSSQNEGTKGLAASGQTGPDGTFTLQTRFNGRMIPGAVAGSHRVVVVPPPAVDGADDVLPVPIRYADYAQSGLTAEVVPAGPNAFIFELKP